MARKREDWIDSWMEYTSNLPSPELWRKWAGIFILGASLERRVWVKTSIGQLFPNIYLVLVGPPGVGKTIMTSQVRNFLFQLSEDGDKNGFHISAASETHASLIDSLKDATRHFLTDAMEPVSYNSLTVISNELGVLLPEYDSAMMSKLTDIYDAHPYSERRRGTGLNLQMASPQINLMAATTPSFLLETLPPGAWDQGFLSRTMLAFSSETMTRDIFGELHFAESLMKDLITDLKAIFQLYGKMTFTAEAVGALENWNKAGRAPLPDHPKLMHYNTRRAAHLLKLCMIASMSRGDSFEVTLDDYQRAMDWLIELEVIMPDIFKAMIGGGDTRAMEEVWYHAGILWAKENGKPIAESRIIAFLAERVPAQNIARVLDIMVRTGIFIEEPFGAPGKWYRPASKKK